jgi:hypothetical protein
MQLFPYSGLQSLTYRAYISSNCLKVLLFTTSSFTNMSIAKVRRLCVKADEIVKRRQMHTSYPNTRLILADLGTELGTTRTNHANSQQ